MSVNEILAELRSERALVDMAILALEQSAADNAKDAGNLHRRLYVIEKPRSAHRITLSRTD